MRAAGIVGETVPLEDADHVCWVEDDADAFTEAAVRFLTVGLARGERLLWVGGDAADRLRNSGGRLAAVDELTASGTLELSTIDAAYGGGWPLVPTEQLRFYEDETRRALADGFRGLRAVAEVTPLAADVSTREAFLAWEHLCDRLVASGSGLSVLCVYRPAGTSARPSSGAPAGPSDHPSDELPHDVVAEAGARHPAVHPAARATAFRVWFDEGATVLAGELDTFGAERFLRLVAPGLEAAAAPSDGVARLDLTGLEFADLAGVRALAAWARGHRERGATVEVIGARRLIRRTWDVLGLAGGLPVTFAEGSG